MKTTSVLEAMHSVIQRTFPTKPHIFKFIENLKLHEAKKSTDLYQVMEGNDRIQQIRTEDRKRAQKIKECTDKLREERITVLKFLDLVSRKKPVSSKNKSLSSVGWYHFQVSDTY